MRTYLLYLLLFLLINSCSNGYWLKEGGYRPIDPKFDFAEESFNWNDSTKLDTNAIYWQLKVEDYQYKDLNNYYDSVEVSYLKKLEVPEYMLPRKINDSSYYFIRFFGNGKVYLSIGLDHFPTINDQNIFNKGFIGYYKFLDKNLLKLELFVPINFGQYEIYFTEIHGDTILIGSHPYKGFFPKFDISGFEKYIKKKGKGVFLYSVPDW